MMSAADERGELDELDPPTEFDELLPTEQEALRMWVRLALEPTSRIGGRFSYSYGLKHHAEDALGWYVSNGQLKGAMLKEGYHWRACPGTRQNPNPNWEFNSRRRCTHRRIAVAAGERVACPQAKRNVHVRDLPFPALCAVSEAEFAEFARLRSQAEIDREAWQAQCHQSADGI